MGTVEKDLKKTGDLASTPRAKLPKGFRLSPAPGSDTPPGGVGGGRGGTLDLTFVFPKPLHTTWAKNSRHFFQPIQAGRE